MEREGSLTEYEVSRRVRWEAAHFLPLHDGPCARLHGHSWSAEVVVRGELEDGGTSDGMVVEMGELATHFRTELEPLLDHQCLNDTMPDKYLPPTTENVAAFLLDDFCAAGFPVARVTVRETENQTATAFANG